MTLDSTTTERYIQQKNMAQQINHNKRNMQKRLNSESHSNTVVAYKNRKLWVYGIEDDKGNIVYVGETQQYQDKLRDTMNVYMTTRKGMFADWMRTRPEFTIIELQYGCKKALDRDKWIAQLRKLGQCKFNPTFNVKYGKRVRPLHTMPEAYTTVSEDVESLKRKYEEMYCK